jgi:hypothetical protein
MNDAPARPPRPAEYALWRLAVESSPPRARARDQQADRLGLDLQKALLLPLVSLDPDPEDLPAALDSIIQNLGPQSGPARGLARLILDDWHACLQAPVFWTWILQEACARSQGPTPAHDPTPRLHARSPRAETP